MVTLIVIGIFVMAFLGAPMFGVLAAFALVGFHLSDIQFAALIVDIYSQFSNNPVLYTVPIFTFAGFILAESRASVRIVNFSQAILGWLPGGLAIVSAPSPVMGSSDAASGYFYVHRLAAGDDGRLDLLRPQRIDVTAQSDRDALRSRGPPAG